MKHVVTAARVLVTAFGSFPGAPVNPTEAVLARLRHRKARLARLGIELHTVRIPVVFATLDAHLGSAMGDSRPTAVLHLGLAARRKAVSVETRAINRAGPLHPDANGRCPASAVLTQGAPFSLPATYPHRAIEASIRRLGVRVARSIDAGDYICNATLYRTLLAQSAIDVGFLHVPRPRDPRSRLNATRRKRPTIDQLADAAFAAILLMTRRDSLRQASSAAVGAPKGPTTYVEPGDRSPPAPGPVADRPAA